MRRRIITASILGFLMAILWLGFVWFNKSTITVSVTGANAVSRTVTIDGKTLAGAGAEGKNYLANVGQGTHKLIIKASGYKEYSADIETGFRENKPIDVVLEKSNISDIAAATRNIPVNRVVNPRFFGGETWMVFSVSGGEGSLVIARYSQTDATWEIVEEGTDFDFDSPSLRNAPLELVNYIKGL